MLRFETAGESHGECLVATLTGLPSGVPISLEKIDRELWRRQQGYGRGGRMKIETDRAHIVSGVRHSITIGAPIAMLIDNKDWKNWTNILPVEKLEGGESKPVTRPRPGHADLAGAIKYDFHDSRYILERASARETTARVAVGALAKAYLAEFGIEVLSHVIAVGEARLERAATWEELVALSKRDDVLLGCVDAEAEQRMKAVVDTAYKTGDTVGGVFEVVARGVPVGLGSHIAWDTRLDGKLAQAIVSMQAVKGVEVGFAAEGAAAPDHREPVVQPHAQQVQQPERLRLSVDERDGIDGDGILHRRQLEQLLEHRLWVESVLDLDDESKAAVPIGEIDDVDRKSTRLNSSHT